MHSRHVIFRLVTSTIRSRCYASTLVLAEQTDGGKLAPVTLNTYVYSYFFV
jgi:hypothetical protein